MDLLANAQKGKMDGFHGLLSLPPERDNSCSSYWHPQRQPFPSTLAIRGARPNGMNRDTELDWELIAADRPFASLDELLNTLGLPNWRHGPDSTGLEVQATSPATIGLHSKIADGRARIEIHASKALDVGKLKLGFQVIGNVPNLERGSVAGEALQWQQDQNLKRAEHFVEVGEAERVQAYLSYDGVPLDQRSVTDPLKQSNPRAAIHRAADPDFQLLEKLLLNPEKKDGAEFENAVSILLTLLGFSSIHYGLMRDFKEGPDIMVVAPCGNVGVVECTTGLLDTKDKLSKLVGRASRIKTHLAEAGHGNVDILPVIVTSLSRDEVKANLEAAQNLQIAVVCKEELLEAITQLTLPPNGDRVFNHAKGLIPRNPDDYFAGMLRR